MTFESPGGGTEESKVDSEETAKPSPKELLRALFEQAPSKPFTLPPTNEDADSDSENMTEESPGYAALRAVHLLKAELDQMEEKIHDQNDEYIRSLASSNQNNQMRIAYLEQQNRTLIEKWQEERGRAEQLKKEQRQTTRSLQETQEQIKNSTATLKVQMDTLPSSNGGSGGLSAAQAETLENLETAVFSPHGVLATFRGQFSTFRDKMETGGGVECANVSFNSKR